MKLVFRVILIGCVLLVTSDYDTGKAMKENDLQSFPETLLHIVLLKENDACIRMFVCFWRD